MKCKKKEKNPNDDESLSSIAAIENISQTSAGKV